MLAYSILADLADVHLAMGESQAIKCVKRFVVGIVNVFGKEYLRAPNPQDTAMGFWSSIDCMYWSWKNCPAA
jgi:hypothetical protein